MILRPYQKDKMIDPAVAAFQSGSRSTVIIGPTGSGKSSVLAWWAQQCQSRNRNVLTICHKQIIQRQLQETFREFGVDTAEVSAGKKISNHKIQVARIQSLMNRLDSIPIPDWILHDEAHHLHENNNFGRAVNYYREKNPDLKTLLVTATPNGMIDGRGLHPFAETMISDLTLKYLVDEGWLVYPHMMRGEKIPKFHIGSNGDYDKKEQEDHFKKKQIIGSAVDSYQQFMDGQPTIISCVSLDHAHFMQEQYMRAAKEKNKEWKFVMIQGGKKYEKQMFDALAGLSSGSVQGLCFVDVLGEGLDVPSCVGLQMMRKLMSYVLFKQFGGRTLRPIWPLGFDQYNSTREERLKVIREGVKPKAEIQDFAGNYDIHGHLLDEPIWTLQDTRVSGKKGDQLPKPIVSVCPKCSGVWPGEPAVCPDCGYDLHEMRERAAGRKPPKEIEGILREVMPGQDVREIVQQVISLQNMPPGARQKAMISNLYRKGNTSEVKGMAKALGYKAGWTYAMSGRLRGRR